MIEGLPKYDVTLHITHNEHKSYYESATQYLNRPEGVGIGGFRPDEWTSREDFDAAIAQDSIWEIQWYPNTPVGFCSAYGSTFENALLVANTDQGNEK
jgi:hypothetical protein